LRVRTLDQIYREIMVDGSNPIRALKKVISDVLPHIPSDAQKLMFQGTELTDESLVKDKLSDDAEILVVKRKIKQSVKQDVSTANHAGMQGPTGSAAIKSPMDDGESTKPVGPAFRGSMTNDGLGNFRGTTNHGGMQRPSDSVASGSLVDDNESTRPVGPAFRGGMTNSGLGNFRGTTNHGGMQRPSDPDNESTRPVGPAFGGDMTNSGLGNFRGTTNHGGMQRPSEPDNESTRPVGPGFRGGMTNSGLGNFRGTTNHGDMQRPHGSALSRSPMDQSESSRSNGPSFGSGMANSESYDERDASNVQEVDPRAPRQYPDVMPTDVFASGGYGPSQRTPSRTYQRGGNGYDNDADLYGEGAAAPQGAQSVKISLNQEENEQVQQLKAMGFDEQTVLQAYMLSDKNMEQAANLLLNPGLFS